MELFGSVTDVGGFSLGEEVRCGFADIVAGGEDMDELSINSAEFSAC